MRLFRRFLHAWLYLPYGYRRLLGTGPFGRHAVVRVNAAARSPSNAVIQALWKHRVKQYNEASCSVASVATVVNALREIQGIAGPPLRQQDLLDAVRTVRWKERMAAGGDNGRRGLPLPLLAAVVESSLDVYGIGYRLVETIPATRKKDAAKAVRTVLLRRLRAFARNGSCVLIAHFDQGAVVPTLNIPHISPVGDYDSRTGRVTILDVDIDQERPYRISFDRFHAGLASDYHGFFRPFGYGSGGAVCIHLDRWSSADDGKFSSVPVAPSAGP